MNVVRIGLDIAKSVFQLHGVDPHDKVVLKKTLSRPEVLPFLANLPPCLVGIEACAGAHYWARELIRLGHDARLMAAEFVRPYRLGGKNDANDAAAICEAVGRPTMRFVSVKSEEAQASEPARRLMQIEGVGPITASAIVASIGNAHAFKRGRQFAAWLGLTPRQNSSGGKTVLGGITKRGDVTLRTLLIHGTRAVLRLTADKTDRKSRWIEVLKARSCNNVAAVALAAKNARIIWAMLSRGSDYRPA